MTLLAKLHHHHQLILLANQEKALINAVPLFLLLVSPVGAVVEDQLLIEASPFPPISSSSSSFLGEVSSLPSTSYVLQLKSLQTLADELG